MIFRVNKIIKDVRVCMDENRTDTALIADSDEETLRLDEVIKSKILEGVKRVHLAAPYHLLEHGHNINDDVLDINDNDWDLDIDEVLAFGPDIHWGTMESGWVVLPDDFLRLVVFKMSDWERAVYDAITPDNPLYARQNSRIKAIRGTAQRPVVALCMRPEGRVLEFYSCKTTDATITRAVYIPIPRFTFVVENNENVMCVDISERCYDAVVYTIASLVSATFKEADSATMYNDKAKTLLGI